MSQSSVSSSGCVSALPAGSFSARQAARSARGLAASLGWSCSARVVSGAVLVVLSSPAQAASFESWLGECVFSRGPVRQCLGWADVSVMGSSVLLSGF